MKRLLIILTVMCLAKSAHCEDTSKPWTFWYWMYGAVSEAGIRADLQAMHDAGLGGCYLMPIRGAEEAPADLPELDGPPAQQLSARFWQMVDCAMLQADSLGLQLGIHICDGFALAGGPWITPRESMQKVVWTDTIVTLANAATLTAGDATVETLLPQPAQGFDGFYEDIGAYACRIEPDAVRLDPQTVTGTIGRDEKGTFRATAAGYIQYDFAAPVTVRSIEVVPSGNNIQSQRLLVQASADGATFTDVRQLLPPRQGWQSSGPHHTYALPATTARHFRFCWTPAGSEPGSEDLDAAKWSPVLKLKDIRLSGMAVVDQYESKNGGTWRIAGDLCPIGPISPIGLISPIGHISPIGPMSPISPIGPMRPIGPTTSTTLPAGTYRILRFGHTSTGHTNATAGGAKGLECDKFSVEAVNKQIDGWFASFMQRPAAHVVKYMHVDSWECGSQNWSTTFADEFRRRRGYDLLPFMPVYAGVPIDGMAEAQALGLSSNRVLLDIRLTINDLLQDVFFATVKQRAQAYGVQLSCESVAPTMVSDGMEHYRHANVPMGEFWLNSPTHDKPNDMLDAISGAHVYGKNIVQAEGFTEVRGTWDETPASIKTLLDRNLALGMNRLFFHVFTHNPWTDKRPGMTLDGIGLFFQRDQTWMPEAPSLVEYITRCQKLLQRGRPVVDIAVYTGDDMPRRAWRPEQLADVLPGLIGRERVEAEHRRLQNVGQPMEESPVGVRHSAGIVNPADWVNPLNGYSYDSMNPDALLHRPFNYSVLVVPQQVLVSDSARQRIEELRSQGVTIIDEPYRERHIDGLPPDVLLPDDIAYCHRRDGKTDIYFLSNQTDSLQQFSAAFRQAEGSVMLYDALKNRHFIDIDDVGRHDGMTIVRMRLEPRQSLFVLFNEEGVKPHVTSRWHVPMIGPGMPQTAFKWSTKDWKVTFSETGRTMKVKELFDWSQHADDAVRYYSGRAVYTTTLKYKGENVRGDVVLRLGDVSDVAHVWLNGRDLGVLWLPPYSVNVDGYLRQGDNTLQIEVVNTWHNALRGADCGKAPYEGIWTNARYRTKGDALLPAGLLGPVSLEIEP